MKKIYSLCVCLVSLLLHAQAQNMGNNLLASVRMTEFFASAGNGEIALTWRTEYEPDLVRYEIEYSKDNLTYQRVGSIPAGTYLNGKAYVFRHSPFNARDRVFYRLKMIDKGGRYDFSPVISQVISGNTMNSIFPTIVNAGVVSLNLQDSFQLAQVVDMQGRVLQTVNLNGRTGRTDISLDRSAKGVCFVRVLDARQNKNIVQKILVQ